MPEGFDIPAYFEKVARDGFERRLPRWRAGERRQGACGTRSSDYRERLVTRDQGDPRRWDSPATS